ncbi:MAG: pyruvate dehydrogenase (acetyl-transferring) E1 component subunit alpha [Desulfobacteraceae bacterium]|nr:pyruvate dehydrogenase (acetyl-transferring) E1 component subunit alpha [Desulfobacteraceae bacterium]
MPRKTLEIPLSVEHLSILDEKGKVDKNLEPKIPKDRLLRLHRMMKQGRAFDQRMLSLQRQGRIGTFPPVSGQEASQLGIVAAMDPEDWMVPAFREMTAELWRGRSMESILISANGFNEGADAEDGEGPATDFPVSVPVGSQMLHAVGIAWGIQYRKSDRVVATFFGDGATSEGDFHEAMNFAGVWRLPVLFVCQNNQWAISIPRKDQTRSETLAQKAIAYGFPGIQVDGNDVLAVYAAAVEAVDRARKGEGPTLIECVTYRMSVHTTADDPKRYRTDEEVDAWKKKDPVERFEKYLLSKKHLTKKKIASLEEDIEGEIKEAVKRAEEKMGTIGDPLEMFDHLYAELSPRLKQQRDALERELSELQEDSNHG